MEEESTMMRTEQIIEHVVLLSAKEEDDPSRVNQMVNSLNSLPLDQSDLIYLTAGPILRVRSSSPGDEDDEDDLRLSHMVHARSRFQSEPDLAALVHQLVLPISDLVVTVDWVAESLDGPLVPKPGSALRLTLFKLKHQIQGDDGVIPSILEGLCKFKSNPGNNPFHLDQISYGKSINIKISSSSSSSSSEKLWCNLKLAALAVFPDLNELDACEEYEDEMRSLIHNHKIQASLHSLIHLDYVLPLPAYLFHTSLVYRGPPRRLARSVLQAPSPFSAPSLPSWALSLRLPLALRLPPALFGPPDTSRFPTPALPSPAYFSPALTLHLPLRLVLALDTRPGFAIRLPLALRLSLSPSFLVGP